MTKEKNILKNYLLYFLTLFLVCLVGISKVFAFEYTYTQVGELYSYTEQLVSTTYGNAPYTNPRNSGYAFSDVFQVDYIVSNYTFNANTNYQLESHLPNQVFTNVNAYKVSGLNGEACMTSYANSILNNDHYPRWAFQCPHQTNTITITIYNSTNQNLWSGTGIFNWSSALLWSSSTAMTSSDTNSIINNQNQNTQDIINNQNQNTQDIENTINDNLNTCRDSVNLVNIPDGSYCDGGYCLSVSNGKLTPNFTTIPRIINIIIPISLTLSSGEYTMSNYLSSHYPYVNLRYNGSTIVYIGYNDLGTKSFTLNSSQSFDAIQIYFGDTNSTYSAFNFQIQKGASISSFEPFGEEICSNKIDDLNDTLNNDDIDDNKIGNAFEDFNDFLDDNSTITQLIVLPITLYTAILNNLNGSCIAFNLGTLFNHNLTLPCIDISQYLGNTLWTMIDIIISGFAIYSISKKMIKAFNSFTFMKDGDVLDD